MYKKGDKVVYVGATRLDQTSGNIYTIKNYYDGNRINVKESYFSMFCNEIVLEEIYNSPLYKALNEEEN